MTGEKTSLTTVVAAVGAAGGVGAFVLLLGGSNELAILLALIVLAVSIGVLSYIEQAFPEPSGVVGA
jgi:hypothetical protein